MLESLIKPHYPKAAIGISQLAITALSLQKQAAGRYGIRQAATVEIPEGVVYPAFAEENIPDPSLFASGLQRATEECGLAGTKNWSVTLPSSTARTAILTLSEVPASRKELAEVLEFKAETSFGVPSDQLRISLERLDPLTDGRTRYLASAIKLAVLDEYETVFESLGWKAGLILSKSVCELKWLVETHTVGDSLLISSQENGFTALLLRNGEPALVRSVTCRDDEVDDEIFRLLVYYNDKYSAGGKNLLSRFLVVGEGGFDERLRGITAEALGTRVDLLQPSDIGLEMVGGSIRFSDVAAPAGIATFGYR
ncbi:MAG: hypothetical protein DWQ47_05815 [Acidobacteria bacterium]|nr:MAG: hypothetical protein DWQ32_09365 [Acidobacteriota bacterium]REK01896.1 MAG: hypothetical protein DWQ38_05800 [Acidobacteriota bacterium]REK14852.1 MAG: hypothetical protein DWQ43_15055 [Acidobacteriota bacterium]REK45567.1 MAG: hypothetical protein DWQ47_05815 [Acidobacteriota bacterium]